MLPRAGRRAQLATTTVDPLASPIRMSATTQQVEAQALPPTSGALSWLDEAPVASTNVAPPPATSGDFGRGAPSGSVVGEAAAHPPTSSAMPSSTVASAPTEIAVPPPQPSPHAEKPSAFSTPAPSVVEVYSDGTTMLATLEREAAQLDASISASKNVAEELERSSHDASKELVNLTTQLEFARRQQVSLAEARAEHKRNHDQRQRNIQQRTELSLSEWRLTVASSAEADTKSHCEQMRKEIAEGLERVQRLEFELEAAMKASDEAPPENDATQQITDGVRSLMRNLRCEFNLSVKALVAAEVRNALQESHSRAVEENLRRTKDRAVALEDHRSGRTRAFEQFRQTRRKDRQDLAETVVADIRVLFRRRLEEKRSKGAVAIREQELRLERDAQQSRHDAVAAIERVASRFAADVASLDKACFDREADLRHRQDTERLHTRKVLEIEIETLQRTLQQEVDFTSRRSVAAVKDIQQSTSFADDGAALLQRLRKLNDDVSFAHASASCASNDGSNETRRLVQEREVVVREMQQYTSSQKESLDRDRARLQSVFTLLEQRCGELEAGMRRGRASLAASQQQVEQTRAVWSRGLRAHVEESGRPLPCVLDGVTDVLFEISVKLRELQNRAKSITNVRRTHFRQQQISDEQVNVKQDESSTKVVGILSLYEEVARLHGDLEAKQRYWAAEKEQLENAKGRLQEDKQAFNEATDLLRRVSEQLRAESAVVKENMRSSAAAGLRYRASKEQRTHPSQGSRADRRAEPAAFSNRRIVDDTTLSRMSHSCYHHLYATSPAELQGHNTELFESLVKVPTDVSGQSGGLVDDNDSYRHPSSSDKHESGGSKSDDMARRQASPGNEEGQYLAAAAPGDHRSSSESLQQARHSLTTPSTES